MISNKMDLPSLHEAVEIRLGNIFNTYLVNVPSPELKEAMQYCLSNGGKRLRPSLVYAVGMIFNIDLAILDVPASAIELMHTYSLIHDDLPAMDNADLRRGQPSCHKVFGDAIAVLTGDALHTLAMQIIATHTVKLKPDVRIAMMTTITKACGAFGMAAGQALDMTLLSDATLSLDLLKNIYYLKTGVLITACMELGWQASAAQDEYDIVALQQFGRAIGLAFQIQDDILDIESTTQSLGKTIGSDEKNHKITYPKKAGVRNAKEKVEALYQEALESINYFGDRAHLLRKLADAMLRRNG